MKYAAISAATMATIVLAFGPASAAMTMCSDTHLSKMTTMMAAMADGPMKWQMNKHLAVINAAMAKDGVRGCNSSMMEMMHGSGMSRMKSMPMMKSGM